MATNYDKWKNIEDSDDEREKEEKKLADEIEKARARGAVATDDLELQERVDSWNPTGRAPRRTF
eukprot:CAMPEP_0169361942 /NCGR_PEP_ID=MMETSP1017-20121227/30633_1 /TAXON_ID=342587 /ORGANISM="Karlodinium micrum, Strain CCMP2283" /LENGTH=63 /DNA_ID=CAMNT_0009459407 /DNA_START=71 /DNA_END=262 /DNA_ORIENTATION=-